MQFRMFVPAAMIALSGIASAQATAPAAEAATPAPAATESTPATPATSATPATPATPATEAAQPVAAASATEKPKQHCHREYPTGSNLPKTVCDTERDPDAERARAQGLDELRHAVRSPVKNPGQGGGG